MFSVNAAQPQAQTGPDLTEIQTEAFKLSLARLKLKLLPSPWPSNALPKPTSTLLSIAPRNELLAAAGPNTLVIATTPTIREAFLKDGPVENNTKSITPQLTINIPRVSHVAFSSDENYLTICADEGGGLSVYDVQALKTGSTQSAFELGTDSIPVRALVPNPAPENGHVTAVVLQNGQLLLANLRDRELASGKQGLVLKDGVSCISWSTKGKQLVAGLGNGTAVQMDPEGDVKAEIPRPPALNGDQHVSGISWLANDLFFIIYTPTVPAHEGVPDSVYMLVTRQPKTSNFTFQKMQDPVGTFGMNRSPPYHFIQRLRDYPPNLTDAILLSSTGSGDIGLITCSKVPLSSEPVAANTANIYTTTGIANDSRRAQLPVNEQPDEMSDGSTDTSPIGMVVDTSSKVNVKRPIPSEEIESSSTPLPALMILNNQGILSMWWFVYSEAVRQGTMFSGLVAATGTQAPTQVQPRQQSSGFAKISQSQPQSSPFGASLSAQQQSSPFGVVGRNPSPFRSSDVASTGTFGTAATTLFGTPSALMGSAGTSQAPGFASFSSASTSGVNNSSWGSGGTATQFGKPTFGSATQLGGGGSSFGTAGGLGAKLSPWGTPSTTSGVQAVEKPGIPFSSTSAVSPFGSLGAQQPASSDKPFGLFSSTSTSEASPFSALSQQSKQGFASLPGSQAPAQPSSFGTLSDAPTVFGQSKALWDTSKAQENRVQSSLSREAFVIDSSADADMDTGGVDESGMAAEKPSKTPPSLFGTGSTGFQLGSTFKADDAVKDDILKPSGASLFGPAFGDSLTDGPKVPATPIKEEPKSPKPAGFLSTTPTSPPKSQQSQSALLPKSTQQNPSPAEDKVREPERLEEPPLPPSPTPHKPPSEIEVLPLPSVPPMSERSAEDVISPAGSPPVDLGEASSSALSSEDEDSEPEDAPLPPDFVSKPSNNLLPEPTWSFPIPAANDQLPSQHKTTVPAPQPIPASPAPAQITRSNAAATAAPPILFPSPSTLAATPRSSSPVRDVRSLGGQHSLTTPTTATHQTSTTPPGLPPANFLRRPSGVSQLSSTSSKPPALAREDRKVIAPEPEEPEEPEDNSDQRIREELAQPVEPTLTLAPFLAHQDYVGRVAGEGVAAQAERLYRDINSMIDTLGLNARSLSSFISGHSELFPDGGRERADLEDDDWCLIEIEDLAVVQKNLGEQLEAERTHNVKEKLSHISGIQRELLKLQPRHHELQRMIQAQKDVHSVKVGGRSEPLTSEQSVVLSDLRKDFATLQKRLVEAEDAISLLKAKLTTLQSYQQDGSGSNRIPTVEAVLNTIAKMTRMSEQKSGDVDLLEAQMRKLKFRSRPNPRGGPPSSLEEALGRLSIGSGRGEFPFVTPPSSKRKTSKQGVYELTYSSDDSDNETPSKRHPLHRSVGASAKEGLKSLQPSVAQTAAYRAKHERRQQFLQLLKAKVSERGTKKTGLDM